jgi:hypothetical protein
MQQAAIILPKGWNRLQQMEMPFQGHNALTDNKHGFCFCYEDGSDVFLRNIEPSPNYTPWIHTCTRFSSDGLVIAAAVEEPPTLTGTDK